MKSSQTIDDFMCDQCGRITRGKNGLPLEVGWIWIQDNFLTTGWATDAGGTFGSMPDSRKHFCRLECFSDWLTVNFENFRLSVCQKA